MGRTLWASSRSDPGQGRSERFAWEGKSDTGVLVEPGVYLYRTDVGSHQPAGKDHRLPMSALSKGSPVLVATFGAASLLASLALPPGRGGSAVADCSPVTVGTDTTSWNDSYGTALGQAIGQTFLARDTLISRLTLWRPPRNATIWGNHLFITEVDSTLRPDTGHILQDGPSVAVRSDGVHLTRMDFVLDPPLALPRPGHYAFFIQRDFCDDGETDLIANDNDLYPDGWFWTTYRTSGGTTCYLPPATGPFGYSDLIFRIEFCRDASTRVRQATWGRLKVIYR